ncbi:hypothetical protein SAMN06265379_101472 [Saccharicrinis carchari]|uniref:Cytochrome C n=1 Tax=Saccharicrinis carchari TaxID=1168039 RepID=A0A521AWC5_SACCC|nr:hypothetical protein [Saccharicrinis carchari]SMO39117.1 hypothetical protein SAMN06265379_101472 [Saccharicrinis carchari]
MRQILLITLTFGLFACNQQTDNTKILQNRIDSLEIKLADTYKPGFGDFMSSIQAHHSKLWFAGQNENWKLADFEVVEIMEYFEAIQKFQSERKETQVIGMIIPPLDSVNIAIQQKNPALFKSSYISLTNACNKCHQAVEFGFNVVKIPDSSPFSNQDFRPVE